MGTMSSEQPNAVPRSSMTSRPRAGRRFEPTHESALLPDAHRACRALPGASRGLTVISEMTGPWGIPDLTAIVGNPDSLGARLASSVPALLHEVDAGIVAGTYVRRGRSVEQIATALSWPVETVLRRLDPLLRSRALQQTDDGLYTRDPAIQPLGRVYAIEAKVSDWRKALQQVRGYSVWADSYVLVMGPLSSGIKDKLLTEVAGDKGGLVVNGIWLRRPSVHPLPTSRRLWASEHVVAAIKG